MDGNNIVYIGSFLAVLILLLFLSILFRKEFWSRFASVLPFLLVGIFLYNMVSFQTINRPYFNTAYQGHLQPLPSNELIDLFETSATPLRADWIYPLIEDYYLGRTLLIPESVVESLDLSSELIISQGRLSAVKTVPAELDLTEREVELIMDLEAVIVPTREVNSQNNITANIGDVYHLVTEEKDPSAPLLLLRYENKLFFIPEDLLPERGETQ